MAKLDSKIDVKKRGSRRGKLLVRSKHKQMRKLKHQINEIEHKGTTRLISTLYQGSVQTIVIGDVRDIRHDNDVGSTTNQKIHQWSFGSVRHKLTYKAERFGQTSQNIRRGQGQRDAKRGANSTIRASPGGERQIVVLERHPRSNC